MAADGKTKASPCTTKVSFSTKIIFGSVHDSDDDDNGAVRIFVGHS